MLGKRIKKCYHCGVTNKVFDKYYQEQQAKGVVIISRNKLISCKKCNTVACTICIDKLNNGAWVSLCPSCKEELDFTCVV